MFIPVHIENDDGMPDRQSRAWVVYSLLLVCTLVHVVLFVYASEGTRIDVFYRFGATRFRFLWWSPLTCTFLHGGWLHLLGNMFFLWMYGRPLERGLGSAGFAAVYASGAFVSVGVHLLSVSPLFVDEPAIGASGAISAVLGAFLVLWPTARLRCLVFLFISFRPLMVSAPAFVVLGLWFVGQLIYTLKLVGDVGGVAFWAHVAGFAWGAVAAYGVQMRWQARETALELEARAPVLNGWRAWQEGRRDDMIRHVDAVEPSRVEDMAGTGHLLRALAAATLNDEQAAGEALLAGFCEAKDYRREAAVLTHYLHLIRQFDPQTVPWNVHRDAGYAAVSMHKDDVALYAFDRALAGGCSNGLDAMARAVNGARRRLGLTTGEKETAPTIL